jgi:hypothetical protein
MYFFLPSVEPEIAIGTMEAWRDAGVSTITDGTVYVQKTKSVQEAKDHAGVAGRRGFSWARFLFTGDEKFLDQIRRAL